MVCEISDASGCAVDGLGLHGRRPTRAGQLQRLSCDVSDVKQLMRRFAANRCIGDFYESLKVPALLVSAHQARRGQWELIGNRLDAANVVHEAIELRPLDRSGEPSDQ